MQDIYEKLEFERIREAIAKKAKTEIGKEAAMSLSMFAEPGKLKKELAFLGEAISLLVRYDTIPVDVSSDLFHSVQMAQKGGILSVEELEHIAHDVITSNGIVTFFSKVAESPLLIGYSESFPHLLFLEKDIHKIIGPDLQIRDSASPKLRGIRIAIAKLEGEMTKRLGFILESNKIYLSDTTMTIKNGHYVLPVANAYKNKVKGIVQDVSASGETTFIEPELIVEMNNKNYELHNDERDEIRRLLGILCSEIASSGEAIILMNKMIGYLDFLQAKAIYAEETNSHIAILSDLPLIELQNARHPLIDSKKVVGNDFYLDSDHRVVVISGPNAGGKTVALKTIGLMIMMNQSGIAIPANEGPVLSFFRNIWCDIGDSQSLSDNLSTFSGHMENVAYICNSVTGRDIVLLDEIGTGTAPQEGEAIAYGVVKYLLGKHAFTIVSSHFEGLKAFALSSNEIVNASMVFDETKLMPTYKLIMGLPGESYGLVVAKRFGLSEEIVDSAQEYLGGHTEVSVSSAIEKLAVLTRAASLQKGDLEKKEIDLVRRSETLARQEDSLKKRQNTYLSDVEEKKNEMLDETKKKIDEIVAQLDKPELKMHEVIKVKKDLDDLRQSVDEQNYSGEVELGDYVSIPSAFVSGRVTRFDGNKVEIVTSDGITFRTKKEKVVRTEAPKAFEPIPTIGLKIDSLAAKSVSLEINIIGFHVDEGTAAVEKYLDQCRIKGFKRVRIIHGLGGGTLRNAVQDYLRSHPEFVKSFELGGEYEGGGGATVVYLK